MRLSALLAATVSVGAISTALGMSLALSIGDAQAATLATLTSWNGSTGYVYGRPIVAANGTIYGVLADGPYNPAGQVYAMTTSGAVTTISTFTGGAGGGFPFGGLTTDSGADSTGDLYGAAYTGGTSGNCAGLYTGCGVIYRLTPPSSGTTWTKSVLYTFKGGSDGSEPMGDLVPDSTGALYGATRYGGCTAEAPYYSGCGTIYKLTPPASGTTWTKTILYTFNGGTTDGVYPGGQLVLDAGGNIFGTTLFGGTEDCTNTETVFQITDPDGGCGTVFKLTKSGGKYAESILHFFTDGADGSVPAPGLAIDKTGNLFGAAVQGGDVSLDCNQYGDSGCGLVFELKKPGAGKPWKKLLVHEFTGGDGGFPTAPLIDATGNLFGETSYNTVADASCPGGIQFYCGTIYREELVSKKWSSTVEHAFAGATDNAGPEFGLAVDSKGTLYGVTESGSTSTVFSLTGTGFPAARHHQ